MSRVRCLLRLVVLTFWAGVFFFPGPLLAARRPHIVFILADDLGYGDIRCFGQERCQIDTPHFDRLAREGIRFTNAHANGSICVPTRTSIMTGRYAWRFGRAEPGGPWGFLGLRFSSQQSTLGSMLSSAGYHTGYFGKWHLGTRMHTTDGKVQGCELVEGDCVRSNVDFEQPIHVGPGDYGFAESFILPGSLDMYPYAFVRNHQWVGEVTAQKGWSAFHRVGPAARDFEDHQVISTFTAEAIHFLERRAETEDEPFLLYLALTSPHTPTSPSKEFQGKSRLGIYGDFVMETDHCVGRVLDALDRLELANDTLVIATSDHGPALYAGRIAAATNNQLRELERDGHHSTGPFRGYKFSAYEGGFRVPFVARYPGVAPAGRACGELVALHDLLATAAELAGKDLRAEDAPDAISFASLLRNPDSQGTRRSMMLQSSQAFAYIHEDWKLLFCPGSGCVGRYGNRPAREDAWRSARAAFGRAPSGPEELLQAPFVQLYHLGRDPGETKNLAVPRNDIVQDLAKRARALIDAGRSTRGPALPNASGRVPLVRAVPDFVWK